MTADYASSQSVSTGTNKNADALFSLMEYFDTLGGWVGANFESLYEQAFALLFDEQDVALEGDAQQFRKLDDKWSEWANRLFRHLENARLDLDFSPDREALRKFLREVSVNRSALS